MDTAHSQTQHRCDAMAIKMHVYVDNATQQPFLPALKTLPDESLGYANKSLSDSNLVITLQQCYLWYSIFFPSSLFFFF